MDDPPGPGQVGGASTPCISADCGKAVKPGARFCPHCGAAQFSDPAPAQMSGMAPGLPPSAPSTRSMLGENSLVLIVSAAVLLVVIAVGAFFLLPKRTAAPEQPVPATQPVAQPVGPSPMIAAEEGARPPLTGPFVPSAYIGRPYAQVRRELLERGFTSGNDEGLFIEWNSYGAGGYWIVEIDARAIVTEIRRPYPIDGLPPIPPPPARDVPRLPKKYWEARIALIKLGYRPAVYDVEAGQSRMVCDGWMQDGTDQCDEATIELPETVDCMPTGLGLCSTGWIAPDGRTLWIETGGLDSVENYDWER